MSALIGHRPLRNANISHCPGVRVHLIGCDNTGANESSVVIEGHLHCRRRLPIETNSYQTRSFLQHKVFPFLHFSAMLFSSQIILASRDHPPNSESRDFFYSRNLQREVYPHVKYEFKPYKK